MGRRVAGSSFAQGLASSLKQGDQLTVFMGSREGVTELKALLQPVLQPGAQVQLQADLDPELIAKADVCICPIQGCTSGAGCEPKVLLSRFSLTGVTHTLCSHRVMQGLEQLVTAPLEPWDALVCTSRSALHVVQEAMACMHERLERRFQQTLPIPQGPQLPLIPLGIDPEPFHWRGRFASRQEQRLHARQQLGLSYSARVVLFLGRLSFHSKAHPLPLYRALDRLSADHELVLLECGHIFNADIAAAYDQLRQRFPHLTLRRLGGLTAASEEGQKAGPGSSRPVLFSRRQPAGNLRAERARSHGQQPACGRQRLERLPRPGAARQHRLAGALPRPAQSTSTSPMRWIAASAWDCRTTTAPWDCAASAWCSTTLPWRRALGDLLAAPERCAAMGEAGRERIESVFAWRVVSEQYRELWSELSERRASAQPEWRMIGSLADGPCRTPCLPATPALHPLQAPGGYRTGQRSQPAHRHHADLLLQQLIPIHSLVSLADTLQAKRQEGGNGWTLMIWNSSTVTAASRHSSGAA